MPWHHKYIGNPGLTALLNLLFHSGLHDSHCGMRGFTREVFDRMDVRSSGMEFASEFVIKAAQLGAKKSEIPITLWRDKRGRPPHLRSFRDGWRHMRFMLLFLGVQIIFSSFFLSMLGISRGTYIGDYDLAPRDRKAADK